MLTAAPKGGVDPINRISNLVAESLTDEEALLLRAAKTYPYGLSTSEIQQLVDLRLIEVFSATMIPKVTELGMDVLLSEALRRQTISKRDVA